jgi:hypothetical protein
MQRLLVETEKFKDQFKELENQINQASKDYYLINQKVSTSIGSIDPSEYQEFHFKREKQKKINNNIENKNKIQKKENNITDSFIKANKHLSSLFQKNSTSQRAVTVEQRIITEIKQHSKTKPNNLMNCIA